MRLWERDGVQRCGTAACAETVVFDTTTSIAPQWHMPLRLQKLRLGWQQLSWGIIKRWRWYLPEWIAVLTSTWIDVWELKLNWSLTRTSFSGKTPTRSLNDRPIGIVYLCVINREGCTTGVIWDGVVLENDGVVSIWSKAVWKVQQLEGGILLCVGV